MSNESVKTPGTRVFDWGDGHSVRVETPDLSQIPGGSVTCPIDCYPDVGGDVARDKGWDEWGSSGSKSSGREEI